MVDAAIVVTQLGELSNTFEERTAQAFQEAALTEVKTEHARYFVELNKHPRLLVGQQVPSIGRDGTETLRDEKDAASWQEAVKGVLIEEIKARASKAMESSSDIMRVTHESIELFQNNPDLIPGTKGFDLELANRFATLATPYELRVEGKLQGYTIPVQPLIDQLRVTVTAERAATKAAGAAAVDPAPAAPPKPPADPPQAGIQSKAGAGGEPVEDFSTLFGTLGLPDLKI